MEATLTPQSSRRRKVTKFALAGVAVLGVGAALTSAAWSDDVFFGANADAATFELAGSADGVTFIAADSPGAAVSIPVSELTAVGPGVGDSTTVYLQNTGEIDVYLNTAPSFVSATGALFGGSDPATLSYGGYGDTILSPGETTSFTITVTGDPDWTGSDYQGTSGTAIVQVQGSSSAP
jgi:hypothetical protein